MHPSHERVGGWVGTGVGWMGLSWVLDGCTVGNGDGVFDSVFFCSLFCHHFHPSRVFFCQ